MREPHSGIKKKKRRPAEIREGEELVAALPGRMFQAPQELVDVRHVVKTRRRESIRQGYHAEVDYSRYSGSLQERETNAYDPQLLHVLYTALASHPPQPWPLPSPSASPHVKAFISSHADSIWHAYHALAASHPFAGRHLQPATLHRIAMHLAKCRPRTREGYLRLLSVINDLRKGNQVITTFEWNTLMDFAGKPWPTPTLEDWESSLAVYRDMLKEWRTRRLDHKIVESGPKGQFHRGTSTDGEEDPDDPGRPDIITYNTLLSIAVRTKDENAIAHAICLLSPHKGAPSPLPLPDSVSLLTLVSHYTSLGQPERALNVLRQVLTLGTPVTIGALNQIMWAYARNGAVNVALEAYFALRAHQADPHTKAWKAAVPSWKKNPILSLPQLRFSRGIAPDTVTYNMLIQQLCYEGRLSDVLRLFRAMVTPPASLAPTMEVFRSIFLGFARHAGDPDRIRSTSSLGLKLMTAQGVQHTTRQLGEMLDRALSLQGTKETAARADRARTWSLATLDQLFQSFISLDWTTPPNAYVLYWIIMGYTKASRSDRKKLGEVWQALEDKFSHMPQWRYRVGLGRMVRVIHQIKAGVEEEKRRNQDAWVREGGEPPPVTYQPNAQPAHEAETDLCEPEYPEFDFFDSQQQQADAVEETTFTFRYPGTVVGEEKQGGQKGHRGRGKENLL